MNERAAGADYEPIDLSALCNAGIELVDPTRSLAVGAQQIQGLPFLIGGAGQSAAFLSFGERGYREPLTIPIGQRAQRIVVAHRLLDSAIESGGGIGQPVADYVFHLDGRPPIGVTIRERFEISPVLDSVWFVPVLPFGAVSDARHVVYPPEGGSWDDAGRHLEEIVRAMPHAYCLWTWANPEPERCLSHLEIKPRGPRFLIAAVTVGHLDEHPFMRVRARDVKIELLRAEDAQHPFRLAVDRGVVGLPYPLPSSSTQAFLNDAFKGWGEAQNTLSSPAYTRVAATPSGTLELSQDGEVIGRVRWRDVERGEPAASDGRVRVELVDQGRNWVRTTVLDADTGQPLPCRIHFRSPEGIPYQPHGHHAHLNLNRDTWHTDVGGDVRLGQVTYAYINGRCEGWLPRGEVVVDVARGYEYEPLRTTLRIEPGQQELTLRLKRWRHMNAERWFSGDTHVHFLSTLGSHLEARGEDLNVVNLLQAQWGHLFTSIEEFTGSPSVSSDGRTIVYVSQENRQHFMGHLILLGLTEPLMPWSSDGPGEAELGGPLESSMSDWADRCRRQGGTVVVPHFPIPNGELAALIATRRVDAVEFHLHSQYRHLEYYRFLNCGYRLPLVGGTDKMANDTPVGMYRTYVNIPADEEFTYDTWRRNLTRGRTFATSGPLLTFSVEGQEIGSTVALPPSGGTVEVEARAESVLPIHSLEIVQHGRVVAATQARAGERSLHLRARLKVDRHTWFAARVGGPEYFAPLRHHDPFRRGVFAHTSPIYVACGPDWTLFEPETGQYMLTLLEGALHYLEHTALHDPPGTVTHHHGEDDHLAYLRRPFLQAREAIEQRLLQGR